jgi:hypothetical protein
VRRLVDSTLTENPNARVAKKTFQVPYSEERADVGNIFQKHADLMF